MKPKPQILCTRPRLVGPSQHVAKPVQQMSKPAQQLSKPTQQVTKPAQQLSKPTQQMNKPAQQLSKPTKQVNKPAQQVNKPAQQLNKPEQKAGQTRRIENEKIESKPIKEDTKKQVSPVKKALQTTTEKAREGHYELNALMKKTVDAELHDIMAKVYEALPSDPADEAESLFVDVMKHDVGKDLRNVLGLNLTKRLLNVYNPLYVKVEFSGKPEKEELREFLRKYNFTAFSRKAVNIFAAQVKSIEDFDRVCGDEDVRCGSVKVLVSPIYKFTACPPNLKTNYIDIDEEEIATTDIKDIDISGNTDLPTTTNSSPVKLTTVETKKENALESKNNEKKPAENNVAPNVNKNVQKEDAKKEVTPQVTKTETKTILQNTPKNNTPSASAPKLKSINNGTPVKIEAKATAPKTEAKAPPTKPNSNSVKTETKTTQPQTPTKSAPAKENNSKPAAAKVTPTKPVSSKVTPTKITPTKPVPKKALNSTPKKSNKKPNDYDELDDEDILALMSEGIVLDECSGSDEE